MNTEPGILILCTGNSCRSQMAAGYFRHYAGDRFQVHSAGTRPVDRVHPLAVQVMAADGIDLTGQKPRHIQEFLGRLPVRYLFIVCDGANEACPRIWPGLNERILWPFDDPAQFVGPEHETLAEFRRVRDQIKQQTLTWLAEIDANNKPDDERNPP